MSNGKVALIILDGYGIGEPNDGNAIYMAQTPVMDGLLQRWPHTKLSASGLDVGPVSYTHLTLPTKLCV